MSILIKGMKMPKACCECGFNHCSQSRDDDTCLLLDKGTLQLSVLVDRLPDCPLVEVPTSHGRLIDADAILSQYNGFIQTAQCDYAEGLRDAAEDVKAAPTIIEAEEGEDA